MALTGTVKSTMNLTLTSAQDVNDGHNANDPLSITQSISVTDGVAANQANVLFHDKRTVATGANDDIDLAGVLTDAFGATITSARIKMLYIRNRDATNTFNIGGVATNPWITWLIATGDGIVLRPGGWVQLVAFDATGYVVTAGTADILRVTHNAEDANAADFDIVIAAGAT